MEYKSLDEIRALLRFNLNVFECIGLPKRTVCDSQLDDERKEQARQLLGEHNRDLDGENRRDVLALLLCASCQRSYTQKNNIKAKWMADSPGIDFGRPRSRSPYTLYSSRPSSERRRSSGLRPTVDAEASPSPRDRGRQPPECLPSSPTEALIDRRRGRATLSSTPTIVRTDEADVVMEDTEPEDSYLERSSDQRDLSSVSAEARIDPVSPRSQTTFSATGNRTYQFTPGEASTWAPGMLRSEVLRLLCEPLPEPESKGSIYAVEVAGTPYVKIGVTTRKVSTRLEEIKKVHCQELDIGGAKIRRNIPLLQLYRLERLIHADLAFFQRDLTVSKGGYSRTHREYFEIDITTADRTIRLWWTIMQSIGLEPGTKVDQRIQHAVQDSTSDIDIPPAGVSPTDHEWWKTLNADHELRTKIWTSAFKLNDGGFRKRRVETTVSWLAITAFALCFLYSLLLPSWVKHTAALLFLSAGTLYTMDTNSSDGCITKVTGTCKSLTYFIRSLNGLTNLIT